MFYLQFDPEAFKTSKNTIKRLKRLCTLRVKNIMPFYDTKSFNNAADHYIQRTCAHNLCIRSDLQSTHKLGQDVVICANGYTLDMQMPAADNWMTTGSQAQVLSSTYGHHSLRYLCEVLFVIHTDETLRVEISPKVLCTNMLYTVISCIIKRIQRHKRSFIITLRVGKFFVFCPIWWLSKIGFM